MDDNIRKWDGATLVNDPNPLPCLTIEPSHLYAQNEEIPLVDMLRYFMDKKEDTEKFSMLGFQMSKRNLAKTRNAYGRQHVFKAFLLNLKETEGIEYEKMAWAMEDVDFNLKVNQLWTECHENGVVVKCQRFIATSQKLDGGILPYNMPMEVEDYILKDLDWLNAKKINIPNRRKRNHSSTEMDSSKTKTDFNSSRTITTPQQDQPKRFDRWVKTMFL